MIRSIALKFGAAPNQDPVKLDVAPVTIFVGPNNSGKSKVLSELHQFCVSGVQNSANVILDKVTFTNFGADAVAKALSTLKQQGIKNERLPPNHLLVGKHNQR